MHCHLGYLFSVPFSGFISPFLLQYNFHFVSNIWNSHGLTSRCMLRNLREDLDSFLVCMYTMFNFFLLWYNLFIFRLVWFSTLTVFSRLSSYSNEKSEARILEAPTEAKSNSSPIGPPEVYLKQLIYNTIIKQYILKEMKTNQG